MRLGRDSIGLMVAIAVVCSSALALAIDIPVPGKKVTIVDKTAINGTAKITSLQKAPNITKGSGGNPALLDGSVEIFYSSSSSGGAFLPLPPPWAVNTATVAKFLNKSAPAGPSPVKVAIVKNGKIAKVVSKGLGGMDISSPPGVSGVTVVFTVENGNDSSIHRLCTRYSLGDGSFVQHKVIAGGLGYQLKLKNGVGVSCPSGTSTTTPSTSTSSTTGPGSTSTSTTVASSTSSTSSSTSTSTSSTIGTCNDGLQNQDETDIDCGGDICPDCALNQDCNAASDCLSGTCQGGVCRCLAGANHTFSLNSNSGGSFDPAEWPGGTQVHGFSSECTVNIDNPSGNIDLVGNLGDDFAVLSQAGFSSCFGSGGEDGDGCDVSSCPPAGFGSCESNRPSCSAALNGSGTSTFHVACNQ